MKEKRKYIEIGDKTYVVAIGGGFDNKFWNLMPSFSITYDGNWRKFKIGLSFLPFWCFVWVGCDKSSASLFE